MTAPWSPTTPLYSGATTTAAAQVPLGGSPRLLEVKRDPFRCHYCHKYFLTVHDFPAYHCNYCNETSCCVNVACIRKLPEECSRYMTTLLKSQAELRLCIDFIKERAKPHNPLADQNAAATAAAAAAEWTSLVSPLPDG